MTKIQNLKIRKNKAFTLVEVLTVVFLGALIIIAAYGVFLASYQSYKKNTESAELTQNARIALERMSREIRQSQEIVVPQVMPPAGGATQNIIEFQDGHTTFSSPSPDPNCSIQYIEYTYSNNNLTRKLTQYRDPGQANICVKKDTPGRIPNTVSEEIKAENIKNLQFWGSNSLITIYIEVSDGKTTYKFETQVSPRN